MNNQRAWKPYGKRRTSFAHWAYHLGGRPSESQRPQAPQTDAQRACAAGANGTDCRKNWGTTAQSIAPFNGGWNWVSCAEYGEPWWNSAKSWAVWTGNGRRQTGPWARHVWGGSDWTQPNGSRQGWQQAEPACGRTGRPIEHLWLPEPTPTTPRCWMRPLWSNVRNHRG